MIRDLMEHYTTKRQLCSIHVSAGTLTLSNVTVTRDPADSTDGDNASFYGVDAAVLATGDSAAITWGCITTTANGAAGVFAYGDNTLVPQERRAFLYHE